MKRLGRVDTISYFNNKSTRCIGIMKRAGMVMAIAGGALALAADILHADQTTYFIGQNEDTIRYLENELMKNMGQVINKNDIH